PDVFGHHFRACVAAAPAGTETDRRWTRMSWAERMMVQTIATSEAADQTAMARPPLAPTATAAAATNDMRLAITRVKSDIPGLQFELETAFDEPDDIVPGDATEWRLRASFRDTPGALVWLAGMFGRRGICLLRVSTYLSVRTDGDHAFVEMVVAMPPETDFVGIRRELLAYESELRAEGWTFRERAVDDEAELYALVQSGSRIEPGCRALTVVGHARPNLVSTVCADLAAVGVDFLGCSMAVLDNRTLLMLILRESKLSDAAIESALDRAVDGFKLDVFVAPVPEAGTGFRYDRALTYYRLYAQIEERAGAFAVIARQLAKHEMSVLWSQTAVVGERPPACVVEIVAAAPATSDVGSARAEVADLAKENGWLEFLVGGIAFPEFTRQPTPGLLTYPQEVMRSNQVSATA
ncbi:MAG: ACT domain-containing protein, partial [Acidimicrobiales bacterium]